MIPLDDIVNYYKLEPHPEGGYYKEIYRSSIAIDGNQFPQDFPTPRNVATSIYYLLPYGGVSHLHRLTSDEIWYFHYGHSLIIHIFTPEGTYNTITLGQNIRNGEVMQAIIPAGTIFGAKLNTTEGYSLIGCVVAPGFDFNDFEIILREKMLTEFPEQADIIKNLTE